MIARHDRVVRCISQWLCKWKVKHEMEKRIGSGKRRPADLWWRNEDGEFVVVDIGITARLFGEQKALNGYYRAKERKWKKAFPMTGMRFQPLILNSAGNWHEKSQAFMMKLIERLPKDEGDDSEGIWRVLMGNCARAIAKGIGAQLLEHAGHVLCLAQK